MQYLEDDSSGEDRPALAFPLDINDAIPENDNQVPTTAMEYLQGVRKQAAKMPNVFVSSETPTIKVVNKTTLSATRLADTPPSLRPSPSWAREQIAVFSALQQRKFNARGTNIGNSNKISWFDLFNSDKVDSQAVVVADFKSITNALTVFDEMLPCIEDHDDNANSIAVRDAILTGCRAQWLYAILTRVHPYVFTL